MVLPMTNTEIETTANAFPEPARSLYLAMKKAEMDSVNASARANTLAESDVSDEEFEAVNNAADSAERAYVDAARAFNAAAAPIVAEGPNMGHAL